MDYSLLTKSAEQQTEYVDTIAQKNARIAELEAENETLRAIKMLDKDQMDVSDKLIDLHKNERYAYDARDEAHEALRDALHALETAQGLWVTDKAAYETDEPYHWRQSFPEQIAKIKAVLGENTDS